MGAAARSCRRFDPQALLCTDPAQEPLQIVRWFVQRWQLEVTFREVRDHLGVETQRQWSDKAIARTTPCLLGLFSIVTLLASRFDGRARVQVAPVPGTTSSGRPSPTALPQHGGQSGASRVSPCPGSRSTLQNFRQPSAKASPTPSATPPEWPNSSFQTIDDVRDAVRTFVGRYNAEWLIEKNGHRSPADMRTAWQEETFRRAA